MEHKMTIMMRIMIMMAVDMLGKGSHDDWFISYNKFDGDGMTCSKIRMNTLEIRK